MEFTCLKSPTGVINNNEIMPFAPTWKDLDIVILSEVSQTEKEKYHMTSLICGIEKEMIQVNLLIKQKETHRLKAAGVGGRMGEGMVRECGMDLYTLDYFKWITKKDLL